MSENKGFTRREWLTVPLTPETRIEVSEDKSLGRQTWLVKMDGIYLGILDVSAELADWANGLWAKREED